MPAQQVQKIRALLGDPDISSVKQGISLLEDLQIHKDNLQQVIGYSKNCSTIDAVIRSTKGWKHKHYVKVWILGRLAEQNTQWVLSIKEIDLQNKKLVELPDNIGNLYNLASLKLGLNQLRQIPLSIGKLSQLKNLELWCNQLTNLPSSIGNVQQLQTLLVFSNRLSELPNTLGNLIHLHTLHLNLNEFSRFPTAVLSLKNLKSLMMLSMDSSYCGDHTYLLQSPYLQKQF